MQGSSSNYNTGNINKGIQLSASMPEFPTDEDEIPKKSQEAALKAIPRDRLPDIPRDGAKGTGRRLMAVKLKSRFSGTHKDDGTAVLSPRPRANSVVESGSGESLKILHHSQPIEHLRGGSSTVPVSPAEGSPRRDNTEESPKSEGRDDLLTVAAKIKGSLKDTVDLKTFALQAVKEANPGVEDLQLLFDKLIHDVPEHVISLVDRVGPKPIIVEHNNYGFTPDNETIEYVDLGIEGKTIRHMKFKVNDVEKTVEAPPAIFDIVKKQIFPVEMASIFADAVQISGQEEGYQIFSVADGCGWGAKARNAAVTASELALGFINKHLSQCRAITIREIVKIQLAAFKHAQEALLQAGTTVGTTTLTVGIIAGGYSVFACLGDSDGRLIRTVGKIQQCVNVTPGSRSDSIDATDPGGRLGNYCGEGAVWKNLRVSVLKNQKGDVIIAGSDGLADNFDPLVRGKKPKLQGFHEWDKKAPEIYKKAKQKDERTAEQVEEDRKNQVKLMEHREDRTNKKFAKVAGNEFSEIPGNLIRFVSQLTLKTKLFSCDNPKKREPVDDYENFPGKNDHVCFVAFQIDSDLQALKIAEPPKKAKAGEPKKADAPRKRFLDIFSMKK